MGLLVTFQIYKPNLKFLQTSSLTCHQKPGSKQKQCSINFWHLDNRA